MRILTALIFALLTDTVAAEEIKPERGYWWGEAYELEQEQVEEEKEPSPEEKYDLPPLPPMDQLLKMHPEQLREMEKKYLDQAIWKRDEESVTEYYTLVAAFRSMSRGFAAVHNYVTMTNPQLSTADAAPHSSLGITAKKAMTLENLQTKLAQENRNYGLLVFVSESCQYCKAMYPIFRAFQNRHGWDIKYIDAEARPDLFLEFSVTSTPTAVLVKAGSNESQRIAQGTLSLPNLELNIYRSVRLMNKEIDLQQFLTLEHQMGGSLDPLAQTSGETP